MATTTKAVPHPTIPGVLTQDESVQTANSYTPTPAEQAEFDTIFKVLADWGTVGRQNLPLKTCYLQVLLH